MSASLQYHVVEVARVTAEDIESALNRETKAGWDLERIDYIKETGVRRPQLAYLYFTRPQDDASFEAETAV